MIQLVLRQHYCSEVRRITIVRHCSLSPDLKFFSYSFFCLTIYSAVLVLRFNPGVMVNDDIAMMSFANGDFTGTPESQLVFIGILIGGLLKLLYTLSSALPWYALVLVFTQIFSGAILLTILYKFLRGLNNRPLICVVSLVALITPTLVLDLSFSTTAMYSSVVGLASLALLVENFEEQGPLITVAVAIILVLAGSLRFGFFLAAVLLLLPIYLLHLQKLSRFTVLLTLGMLLLPVASQFAQSQFSKIGNWASYQEFNELRGSMHGTPGFSRFTSTAYEEETIEKLREFGWESEDLLLFGSWYFEDDQVFNTSSLKRLKENIDTGVTKIPLQTSLENIFFGREFIILFGFMIVFLGTRLSVTGRKNFLLFQVLWFFTVALYISSSSRFPDRFAVGAIVGLYVCILVANLILEGGQSLENTGFGSGVRKIEVLFFTFLVFTGVFLIPHKFSASQLSNQNKIESTTLKSELQALDDVDPNGTIVFIGAQIMAEGINPWTQRTLLEGNRLLGLGWPTRSPHMEKRKKTMGLDGNFLSRFIDEPHKYLLTNSSTAELLESSYERRAMKQIKMISLKDLPFGAVFKVVSEEAPPVQIPEFMRTKKLTNN